MLAEIIQGGLVLETNVEEISNSGAFFWDLIRWGILFLACQLHASRPWLIR